MYKTIVADPPWSYRNKKTGGSMISGSEDKYPTMSLEEICELPIGQIADKDSVLFLWVTTPLLPEGFDVMKAWGYKYKTTIYWRKVASLGMGFWFRGQIEQVLFGIKGKVGAFRCQRRNFIQSKSRSHSKKPEEFFRLIEPVIKKHNLDPKIELFATEKRAGWDAWGLEVESDIEMV